MEKRIIINNYTTVRQVNKNRPRRAGFHGIFSNKTLIYFGLIPSVILIFGIFIIPFVYSIVISFFDFTLTRQTAPFIGLKNYIEMLTEPNFGYSVGITLYFTVVSVGLELIFGLLIALVLNQPFPGCNFVKIAAILPWAIPTVVNAYMWRWIFNPQYGVLNAIAKGLGLIDNYVIWLGTPMMALHSVILADIYTEIPLVVIIILANLQVIDPFLYESARIDGASRIRILFSIILPLLRPTLLFLLIIRSMAAFRVFDILYILTSGGPAGGTKVLAYYMYEAAFSSMRMGFGSAVSNIMTLTITILSLIYFIALKRVPEYQ